VAVNEAHMTFLTTTSLWVVVLALVVLPTAVAMAGTVLVRSRVPLESLASNNEVAGFKFAVIGVLYAVLLAFAVIVVWESFSDSEGQVTAEAGAAATLYRLADGFDVPGARALHQRVTDYIDSAVRDDWPAMAHGEGSEAATRALDALHAEAMRLPATDARAGAVLYEILYQLDQLTQARRARIDASTGFVPWLIWRVLFLGGILTVGFTHFFGTRNLAAQTLMTGILTVLIGSTLLVIVAIDRPFSGSVQVPPDALLAVRDDLGSD
jgi:hypothetical protein